MTHKFIAMNVFKSVCVCVFVCVSNEESVTSPMTFLVNINKLLALRE